MEDTSICSNNNIYCTTNTTTTTGRRHKHKSVSSSIPLQEPQQEQEQQQQQPQQMCGQQEQQERIEMERVRLLRLYLPSEFVEAYCGKRQSSIALGFHNSTSSKQSSDGQGEGEEETIPHDELFEALQVAPNLVADETPYQRYLVAAKSAATAAQAAASVAAGADAAATTPSAPPAGGRGSTSSTSAFVGGGGKGGSSAPSLSVSCPKSIIREAARKLATHWRYRKALFDERAFLPMIQTSTSSSSTSQAAAASGSVSGDVPTSVSTKTKSASKASAAGAAAAAAKGQDSKKENRNTNRTGASPAPPVVQGALSEYDMELFNTGFAVMLPPGTDHAKGRTVMAIDRALLGPQEIVSASSYDPNLPPSPYEKAKMRILFYMLQISSTNPVSQIHGIGAIGLPLSPCKASPYWVNVVAIILDAFPIPVGDYNAIFLPSKTTSVGALVLSFVSSFLQFYNCGKFATQTTAHFGMSDDAVIRKLRNATGWKSKDIPIWMGGTGDFDLHKFRKWREKQHRTEISKYAREVAKVTAARTVIAKRSLVKRARAKERFEFLQHEVLLLQKENSAIQIENERLEKLLEYAMEEVNIVEAFRNDGGHDLDDEIMEHKDMMNQSQEFPGATKFFQEEEYQHYGVGGGGSGSGTAIEASKLLSSPYNAEYNNITASNLSYTTATNNNASNANHFHHHGTSSSNMIITTQQQISVHPACGDYYKQYDVSPDPICKVGTQCIQQDQQHQGFQHPQHQHHQHPEQQQQQYHLAHDLVQQLQQQQLQQSQSLKMMVRNATTSPVNDGYIANYTDDSLVGLHIPMRFN